MPNKTVTKALAFSAVASLALFSSAALAQSARPAALSVQVKKDVVIKLGTALRGRYVFPNVGEKAATRIGAAMAAGEYDGLENAAFAARLNADVAAMAHDKHLNVGWLHVAGPLSPQATRGQAFARRIEPQLASGVRGRFGDPEASADEAVSPSQIYATFAALDN
jgi:hypothetical protein